MPQFFIDKKFDVGDDISISGPDAHHISDVLRLVAGDWIVLSDGDGRSFRAKIGESSPKMVTAKIEANISHSQMNPSPVLALSLIKPDRFEWAIEKAVELGCDRIMPMMAKRTAAHLCRVEDRKLARWRHIAVEAAKQSGLPFRPAIDCPATFAQVCESTKGFGCAALFYEGEEDSDIRKFWGTHRHDKGQLLIIGPEGGFSGEEIAMAKDFRIATVSLGRQILRVETAAISALAIWQYELENLNAGKKS